MAFLGDKDIVTPSTPTTSEDIGLDVAETKAQLTANQEAYTGGKADAKKQLDEALANAKATLADAKSKTEDTSDIQAELNDYIKTLTGLYPLLAKLGDNAVEGFKGDLSVLKSDTALKVSGASGQSSSGKYYLYGKEVDKVAFANGYGKASYDAAYKAAYDRIKADNPGYWEENIVRDAQEEAARLSGSGTSGTTGGSFGATVGGGGGGSSKTFTGFDANNQPMYSYGASSTSMTQQQYTDRTNVMDTMRAKFKDYGLEALIPTIEKLAMEGATESTITLSLRESDAYKQRFSANEDRKKAGLAVLDPRTYLAVEDSYRQTLRAYGLKQFDNDNYVKQFIANDMSPTELANRVSTAVERVQNADPEILRTLQDYYGIGSTDLVSYTLDPEKQFETIKRQVSAAEIGAAARNQGLRAGASGAEALAAQGVTQAQAQQGYAAIADILPTASKLSDIYGNQTERYDQTAAEQETFGNLASAKRKRQQLTGLEIGTFSGQSGMTKVGLSSKSAGQF
jgi:hypothetical protein